MNSRIDSLTKNKKKKQKKRKNKGKCLILSLKDDNLLHIISYLKEDEKILFYGINTSLYELKRLYFPYYSLNQEYSHKYCLDKKFRIRVNERVKHETKKRLALEIRLDDNKMYSPISIPESGRNLRFIHCDKIKLSWYKKDIDLKVFRGVHTLDLSECSKITDVSGLGGVHTLDLYSCSNITDVSGLGGVHTLDLCCCDKITDVSGLGGVHTLNLSGCGITDVSALGGVYDLKLSHCSKITDVSMLGGVHTLNLS